MTKCDHGLPTTQTSERSPVRWMFAPTAVDGIYRDAGKQSLVIPAINGTNAVIAARGVAVKQQ